MTEAEALEWLSTARSVSRETLEKMESFAAYLKREAVSQNLVASSTLDHIWARHIVDSAQLLSYVEAQPPRINWLDLGSGAGFPGLIIALLSDYDVTLVESRARRSDYLQRAIDMLDLGDRVTVAGIALEKLSTTRYSVISARAFAPLPKLFTLAERFSTNNTLWLLPKGRNAAIEWEDARNVWNGEFRVEQSITDSEAGILVGKLIGRQHLDTPSRAKG